MRQDAQDPFVQAQNEAAKDVVQNKGFGHQFCEAERAGAGAAEEDKYQQFGVSSDPLMKGRSTCFAKHVTKCVQSYISLKQSSGMAIPAAT